MGGCGLFCFVLLIWIEFCGLVDVYGLILWYSDVWCG